MRLYLDTSALVKMVVAEPQSVAVRDYLRDYSADSLFTAPLSRTELVRAVASAGPAAVTAARMLLDELEMVTLSRAVLDDAASLPPRQLRSLDAIHLTAALRAESSLRAVVTYDARMSSAASGLGLSTAAPA
jgi:uncharacterized protein